MFDNTFTRVQDQAGIGYDLFWDALFQCEGLETLEISSDMLCKKFRPLDAYAPHIQALAVKLPKLKRFRICLLEVYCYRDAEIAGFDGYPGEVPALFWRMWMDFPFLEYKMRSVEEIRTEVGPLYYWTLNKFKTRVQYALNGQFHIPLPGHGWPQSQSTHLFNKYPLEHVRRFVDNLFVTVTLPSDPTSDSDDPWVTKMSGELEVELEVMGLPIA
jgi:hypothetical protein